MPTLWGSFEIKNEVKHKDTAAWDSRSDAGTASADVNPGSGLELAVPSIPVTRDDKGYSTDVKSTVQAITT